MTTFLRFISSPIVQLLIGAGGALLFAVPEILRLRKRQKACRDAGEAMRRAIHRAGLPPRRWSEAIARTDHFTAIYSGACSVIICPVAGYGPFAAGEGLTLREWSRDDGTYTGRLLRVAIVHYSVDQPGLIEGYAVLSIRLIVPNR